MATFYELHPDTPQDRRVEKIINDLKDGAVMLYPTDTVYAIGCDLYVKSAVEKVRQIKQLSNDKPLTFLCSSLSNIANYAVVNDSAYRIIKRLIPGPYTFVLPATKLVPRLVMSPKRKTTGIRVPNNQVCLALLKALDNPIISTSANITSDAEGIAPIKVEVVTGKAELFDCLENLVDIIVDDGSDSIYQVSTIVDLTGHQPNLIRQGLGVEAVISLIS
ncbi:MAG: L-threonylcarbamoyladenylate synthase [Trichodesmium sp. St16_bin4-tuft]|nr:threonylcarbamoyl-AMP synthase [Trichodesmium sp. MAG_R01]MDE5069340.1 L-threonylcarbamoyladenylate synthase [Trichodesmium sp. St4_bin8_1]MDE5071715.1 L-threonylcarbamoyladenylate synthase [Trichodesmium sp. St5_bin8]MDE5078389.1 L-threonylcarbamoyladenylate synthase [Trichodesmium sp. St2_bin6]MDE5090793.1 L-threonylcarbamoyladenylate synthase [Trichodesmium sp. St18_bin3_1_1]MDE5099678.1 L-threonylcarbamoyladenylate synthase [Trichodesmium sp. St16_bin4-tuft]MDE5105215.1 L-threonylcarba